MAKNNFPKTEKEFHAWFSNFQQAFSGNYEKYGFKSSDVSNLNRWYKSWQNSYNFWNSFNQFYSWYTKFHNTEFTSYKGFLFNYWSQIQSNPNWDGNWQRWFGVTAPKSTSSKPKTANKSTAKKSTAKKAPAKKTTSKKTTSTKTSKSKSTPTTAPTFWYEWKNGNLWFYAGVSKKSGWSMPTWAKNCTFEYKTTGGTWRKLWSGSRPYAYSSTSGKKVWYRAYWTNTNGTKSGYSKPMAWDWGTSKNTSKKAA